MTRSARPALSGAARARLAAREKRVGAMLPYAAQADAATLTLRNGALMQCIHLAGFASETADNEDLNYRKLVRETTLRAIANERIELYHHIIRTGVPAELPRTFANAFAGNLDDAWRSCLEARQLHRNALFITVVRKPPTARMGLLSKLMDPVERIDAVGRARARRELDATVKMLLASLEPYAPRLLTSYEADGETYSEPLEMLSAICNGEFAPTPLPGGDIGNAIARRRLSFGGDALEFGADAQGRNAFAAMLSLKDYPPQTHPGQLDAVARAPREMVITQRFSYVPRQSALGRIDLALRRMHAADDDAVSLRRDLSAAKDDVAAGRAAFGEHHLTIMVKAATLPELDEAVAETQSALAEAGALGVREDVAMEPAFWAQVPGNASFAPRPALISSGNFASLASLHNAPSGKAENNHWGAAITTLETAAGAPYHFNFHKGDLGNFTIIGPSGSGKTVLLNFLLAQAQHLAPRIVFFDKDRGAEIFLRALEARYEVLQTGVRTGFNPLAIADTATNRRFLARWTGKLLSTHGDALSAEDEQVIAEAVAANFEQEPRYRRLRYFRELFSGARRPSAGDLAARLAPWVDDGDRAWLFDNEADQLDLGARIVGFDMTELLDDPALRTPTMMYLFHRVEERLDGTPAIVVVDEGWKALDDAEFVARLRDWEKTLRKRNGIVGFCTQNAGDALQSSVASAIIEQSATQIFLPNAKAQERDYCAGFGLSAAEFHVIRTLPDTSRCFLLKSGEDSLIARLDLSGLPSIINVLSGRTQSVQRLDALRAQMGDDPARWLPALLEKTP